MPYSVPPLPYAYSALEPFIDTQTMEIHHDKHHQKYVDDLNNALEGYPELSARSLVDLVKNLHEVPETIRTTVRNNAGGHYNHTMFWMLMKKNGGGEPKGQIAEEINKKFKSFGAFQQEFATAAKSRFGSGWAWLSVDKKGDLVIHSTANQDTPYIDGYTPIFGLDVWEHAYYLKYQNRRPDYITAWWNVVNWEFIEESYRLVR